MACWLDFGSGWSAPTAMLMMVCFHRSAIEIAKTLTWTLTGVLAKNSAAYNEPFEMVSCGNGTNTCCFQGDKCGSNLLCMNSEGTPTRQYCAEANWEGCSSMCAGTLLYYPSGVYAINVVTADMAPRTGTLLVDCGKNMYCCGAVDASCCNDDDEHFFVDPNTGEVKHPSKATGASATASPTWWTVDSKALLAATSSLSPSSSSATSASTTDTSSAFSTSSSYSTTTPTSTPTTSAPPQEEGSKGLSASAGAGIGIGAAAGIALLVGLVWFLLKRRKQKNVYEAPADQYATANPYAPLPYGAETKPHGDYYAQQGQPGEQSPQELDGMMGAQEVPGMVGRHEVHGESRGV